MMIEQVQDAYTWSVWCADGTVLCEYDRPEGRGFAEVASLSVVGILLLPLQGVSPSYRVDIPQGAQPVFFRRRSVTVSPLAGESEPRPTTHCIGWKKDEQAVYLFVFDGGSTLLTSDLQAV
jgi:hypothetical protein